MSLVWCHSLKIKGGIVYIAITFGRSAKTLRWIDTLNARQFRRGNPFLSPVTVSSLKIVIDL
jgi:hypothetical protein